MNRHLLNLPKSLKLALALLVFALSLSHSVFAQSQPALPTPPEVWKDYHPDAGDFKEEIVTEETKDGIYYRDSYISAYVNGEEIRVFCKYAVKAGAMNAPGLMDVHGWMALPRIDQSFVSDGWAVMAHDYCGKTGDRPQYTKYPEKMRYGNMDGKVGYRIKSKMPDGQQITDPKQTDDYLWYAIQRRVLSYLLAQKEVDKSRIGAKGYSYGGTLMWNLGMDPRVKAIVAYFGIGWLDFYRDKQVFLYKVPYVEPPKTSGEELILAAIAPEAHAPFIRAASLWLNGTNDHHGGHERGEQTFKKFQPGVPWSFAHQARAHHETSKLGNDCKLWLEKYVLGKDIAWPARPVTEIKLDVEGVPELHVMPTAVEQIETVEVYYALKEPVNIARFWIDTKAEKQEGTWVAKLPVKNIGDYVFAFANIRYRGNMVISTDFMAAIPSKLGKAVATRVEAKDGSDAWTEVGPVEGVGGVKGLRALNNNAGTTCTQFDEPNRKAPEGAVMDFRFYCTQPLTITLTVNDHFSTEIEITASDDWQAIQLRPEQLRLGGNGEPLKGWSQVKSISLKPKAGSDISKMVFADITWKK